MASTVTGVLAAAGLTSAGAVPWGTLVPEPETGIYLVSLSENPDDVAAAVSTAPMAVDSVRHLLTVRTELTQDGARPTAEALAERIGAFWLPSEVVLYIGLAGQPVRTRVRQYFKTPLGAAKPHAGGWWLKTLAVLDDLWVHWAPTANFKAHEEAMLAAFAAGVDDQQRAALPDQERVAPFANIRCAGYLNKRHGLADTTGTLQSR